LFDKRFSPKLKRVARNKTNVHWIMVDDLYFAYCCSCIVMG